MEKVLKTIPKGETATEYLPLREYYHRHSRALFWEIQVNRTLIHLNSLKVIFYEFFFADL